MSESSPLRLEKAASLGKTTAEPCATGLGPRLPPQTGSFDDLDRGLPVRGSESVGAI